MELFDPRPKFKSFHEDKEVYVQELMDNGIIESGLHKKLGMSPIQIAHQPMFDAYAKKELWSLIALDFLIYGHEDANALVLSNGLVETGDFVNLQRLWRTHLSDIRAWYWRTRESLMGDGPVETLKGNSEWEALKGECIEAYKVYEEFVDKLAVNRELDWIREEIDLLENEKIRQPRLSKPLKEKIDEAKFWSIIDSALAESSGSLDLFNGQLVDLLQDYKQTDIKRFQNILLDHLEKMNRWDLWAVAYLSQGGCSENSFLYFRCWLISQGELVCTKADNDLQALLPHVPKDGFVLNEGLLYVAYEAYQIRSKGKEMVVRERKDKPPVGDVWTDSDVESFYPDIVNFYR